VTLFVSGWDGVGVKNDSRGGGGMGGGSGQGGIWYQVYLCGRNMTVFLFCTGTTGTKEPGN